ncbi:unnamed protein product [Rhizoctonia solani]|uniref:EXPERA domain-containing protein n=1 Tax=Rhizoctonia solani TaxID=456999 RepID=A0A8H3HVS2_9AGAM|nr:unnamed protein product [Rhizoctonia solani]
MSVSLKERPLDFLYLVYFAIHIPPTLLMDLQAILPRGSFPRILQQLPQFYLDMSGDPLIAGAMGLHGVPTQFTWFYTFLVIEELFQLPLFILGIYMLRKNSSYTSILLTVYGSHVTTTMAPVLATLLATPKTISNVIEKASDFSSLNSSQFAILLSSYIPFLIIPLVMAVDGTRRLVQQVHQIQKLEKASKRL